MSRSAWAEGEEAGEEAHEIGAGRGRCDSREEVAARRASRGLERQGTGGPPSLILELAGTATAPFRAARGRASRAPSPAKSDRCSYEIYPLFLVVLRGRNIDSTNVLLDNPLQVMSSKRRAGRPREFSTRVSVPLRSDEYESLRELADDCGQSLAHAVRRCIRYAMGLPDVVKGLEVEDDSD